MPRWYGAIRQRSGSEQVGEVSVLVFFGLVATVGTTYVLAGVGCGSLACALLVANNLRDRPKDESVGKRTLAVGLSLD